MPGTIVHFGGQIPRKFSEVWQISTTATPMTTFANRCLVGTIFSVVIVALMNSNMKRLVFFLTLGLFGFLVMGADHRQEQISAKSVKRACTGYTVIEASKGVDCNGDTIKLVKVSGFYQRVR